MAKDFLYQLVYCSRQKNRAWRREIMTWSSGDLVVTNFEIFPPINEAQVMKLIEATEYAEITKPLRFYAEGLKGCPYCSNPDTYRCDVSAGGCGVYSCAHAGSDVSTCGHCGRTSKGELKKIENGGAAKTNPNWSPLKPVLPSRGNND